MPDLPAPPVPDVLPSQAGRVLHDLGLASLFGGNLFARVAMNSAIAKVSSPTERGQVVNAAWRRYGTVNSLSLIAVIAGWVGARAGDAKPANLSAREQRLATVKDGLVAATALTGVSTAVAGVRFNAQTAGGDIALQDGATPADEANDGAAKAKRILNVMGVVNLACTASLIAINAALAQENYRRPALRRVLPLR